MDTEGLDTVIDSFRRLDEREAEQVELPVDQGRSEHPGMALLRDRGLQLQSAVVRNLDWALAPEEERRLRHLRRTVPNIDGSVRPIQLCFVVDLERRRLNIDVDHEGIDEFQSRLDSLRRGRTDHLHLFTEEWGLWPLTLKPDGAEGVQIHRVDLHNLDWTPSPEEEARWRRRREMDAPRGVGLLGLLRAVGRIGRTPGRRR